MWESQIYLGEDDVITQYSLSTYIWSISCILTSNVVHKDNKSAIKFQISSCKRISLFLVLIRQ